jgi:hypothetical protein
MLYVCKMGDTSGGLSIFPHPYGTLQAAWYTRGIVPIQSNSAVIVLESRSDMT